MKIKMKKKFDEMKQKQGTIQEGESMTDQSQAEDCDVYACLKKYGIQTLVNQTMAKEPLFLDNTYRNMTLDDAIRTRKEMEEYFKQQPARVRKVFGDNVDMFIEKYKRQEFGDFLSTGVLNEELVTQLKGREENNVKVEESLSGSQGISTDINKGNTGAMEPNNGSIRNEQS